MLLLPCVHAALPSTPSPTLSFTPPLPNSVHAARLEHVGLAGVGIGTVGFQLGLQLQHRRLKLLHLGGCGARGRMGWLCAGVPGEEGVQRCVRVEEAGEGSRQEVQGPGLSGAQGRSCFPCCAAILLLAWRAGSSSLQLPRNRMQGPAPHSAQFCAQQNR